MFPFLIGRIRTDKKLNYELSKELHTYQKWLNDVNSYIINKTVFGGGNIR